MSTDKRLAIKPALNQFNGGEISPQLEGRYDWDKYNYSAKLCKNFIPTVEGYLKRRGGTHFVSEAVERPNIRVTFGITNVNLTPFSPVLIVNNTEVELLDYFFPYTATLSFPKGEVVNYSVRANGYVPVSDSFIATYDSNIPVSLISLSDAATLTIVPDPAGSIVTINGIQTNSLTVEKNTTVTYEVTYGGGKVTNTITLSADTTLNVSVPYTVFEASTPQTKTIIVADGYYTVSVIGAGGGAGGGSWRKGHKYGGSGGGSGAGFVGVIRITGEQKIQVGGGGQGGQPQDAIGYDGANGESSFIGNLIIARAGQGGKGARTSETAASGGTLTVNATVQSYTTRTNGNSGTIYGYGGSGGASVSGGYGKGGNGVYMAVGEKGGNGYVKIEYYGGI